MIGKILDSIWIYLVIGILITSLVRYIYLTKTNKKVVLYRELLIMAFVCYLIVLYYVVTFKDVSFGTSNLIPFREIMRYEIGSRLFYKNIIGNLILFIPFGFFIGYFFKINKVRYGVYVSMILSIIIELTQLMIGRIFDIDDIILNIIGGTIGIVLYYLMNKYDMKTSNLNKKIAYNIIVVGSIIIISIVIFYAWRYGL